MMLIIIIITFWKRYNKMSEMYSVLQMRWNKVKSESDNKKVDKVCFSILIHLFKTSPWVQIYLHVCKIHMHNFFLD